MKRFAVAALATFTVAFTPAAFSQQPDFNAAQVKVTELAKDTFMLEGIGGNVTVAAGTDGVIMVDGQFAPMHDKLKAAIDALTGQPIKYLVNTHYHGDHVGGNAAFSKDGAVVFTHENIAKRLGGGAIDRRTGAKVPPVEKDAMPKRTYKAGVQTLAVGGRTAKVGHPLNAHTDGDSYVYFADANVLATGDIMSYGNRYVTIDYPNGGSIDGIIAAVDQYLKIADDKTKIVPGHGPVANKIMLGSYRLMLITARDRVARAIGEGKTEQQAVDEKPLADMEKQWGTTSQQSDDFVKAIYASLKQKK
jgi:glyoxylase-like metal-dependent hydrolase (beta-lactamase superfamily II)